MATSWSLDYCLACDRQTSGEAYCSQSCRLADLESSSSASTSPTSPAYTNNSSKRNSATGFHLAPAFDFSAYRNPPLSKATASPSYRSPTYASSRPTSVYFASAMAANKGHGRTPSSPKILTPSSSQASLSSLQSTEGRHGSADGISRQARNELRDYTNSFDQVRDQRRRRTHS